jgi:hypothetical protein
VRRTWDDVEVKTVAGLCVVPLTAVLRELLVAQMAATGRRGDDLVFAASGSTDARVLDSLAENDPKERENPAVAGHS